MEKSKEEFLNVLFRDIVGTIKHFNRYLMYFNYVASDGDGSIYVFEHIPVIKNKSWFASSGRVNKIQNMRYSSTSELIHKKDVIEYCEKLISERNQDLIQLERLSSKYVIESAKFIGELKSSIHCLNSFVSELKIDRTLYMNKFHSEIIEILNELKANPNKIILTDTPLARLIQYKNIMICLEEKIMIIKVEYSETYKYTFQAKYEEIVFADDLKHYLSLFIIPDVFYKNDVDNKF